MKKKRRTQPPGPWTKERAESDNVSVWEAKSQKEKP